MISKPLKIYVGYDAREDIAWQVCRHSLLRHASKPVEIYPLKQVALRELGLYNRSVDASATTEFSITRFLTPYLAAFDSLSIFVDCDFLFTADIYSVVSDLDESSGVSVVKHDYVPRNEIKMDGKKQTTYPRKNWSSFIVFNGANPYVKALTPEVVNSQTPAFLHRFNWIEDNQIGGLPLKWNFLEGEYPKPDEVPAAMHYTNGGPWFENWQNVDFADLWTMEREMYASSTLQQVILP